METLQQAYDREVQAEADRAELARLKAEEEERERERHAGDEHDHAEPVDCGLAVAPFSASPHGEVDREVDPGAEAQAKIDEAERKQREAEEALAAKQAEDDRLAAEAEKRQRDQDHRSAIMRAAKEAIMEHGGVKEAQAKSIVLAIGAGSIPNISLQF